MSTPRLALVTSADQPELDAEDARLLPALEAREIDVDVVAWDDPAVDWPAYDLALLRSVPDYTDRKTEFLDWAGSVGTRLANPPNVVRWNTDKHYLQELEEHGLPVVNTLWLEPNRGLDKRALHNRFPAREDFVIKPAIGSGSKEAGRYTATDADSRRYAIEHAMRLLNEGRSVMVQRYLPEVDSHGEIALVYFHGTFSHAMRKESMLSDFAVAVEGEHREEAMEPYKATAEEVTAGQQALAFSRARIPGRSISSRPLLYSRVDLVPANRVPVMMELELVEPALFCSLSSGAVDRFADAIVAELRMGTDPNNIDLA